MAAFASTDLLAAAEALLPDAIAMRRTIHQHPEQGLLLPRTQATVLAALETLPLRTRTGTQVTSVVADLAGERGAGRTVLLRGDMDALPMQEDTGLPFASRVPGAMHACGHDAHSAMLVGAARALCARKDSLPGTVVFMSQPGEEGYHGARYMIEDGLLDIARPEAAFALHISPNASAGTFVSRPGPLLASTDTLHATIRGRGGHAAMPHDTLDPIPVACEIVTALQTFLARRVPVSDPAVLTIAQINAGSAHNIVPQTCEMTGTLRTLSERTRELMRDAFTRIVENIAAAHGLVGEVRMESGYPVTMNDPRAYDLMRGQAIAMGGEDAWQVMPAPMMGAEDFAYVLREMPGAMAFIGVAVDGSDPRTNPPLHNTKMTIDEATMARGVALHCAAAAKFLEGGFD